MVSRGERDWVRECLLAFAEAGHSRGRCDDRFIRRQRRRRLVGHRRRVRDAVSCRSRPKTRSDPVPGLRGAPPLRPAVVLDRLSGLHAASLPPGGHRVQAGGGFGARGPNWAHGVRRDSRGGAARAPRSRRTRRFRVARRPARACVNRARCLRLGLQTRYAKARRTCSLQRSPHRSSRHSCALSTRRNCNALAAAAVALSAELERTDSALADRLTPVLFEFTAR
jgi:hypothetical protein